MSRLVVEQEQRQKARLEAEFRDVCTRVARLLTATPHASQEDADFFMKMLDEGFVKSPSMVTFEISDAGALVVSEVLPDALVHYREGQKSVVQYILHAIAVGRAQNNSDGGRS